MLPKDPIILLSTINTKLRDHHPSLDDLCVAHGYSAEDIIEQLTKVDYHYDKELNQFK